MDEEKLDSNANFIKNVEKILISALSFVSALAWNSAFQNLFERNKFLKNFLIKPNKLWV